MERFENKFLGKRYGWRCELTPEEMEAISSDMIMINYQGIKKNPDGSGTLMANIWNPEVWDQMGGLIEGLGENRYETFNVTTVRGVQVRTLEF